MSEKNSNPSTRNSTKSRRSTASGTVIKKNKTQSDEKNRWFRLEPGKADLPEFDRILDVYWGGPERRITGLTTRIIAVNAVALLMLMVGTLYLGQYQKNLIETKLETFQTEIDLISAALSEGAVQDSGQLEPVRAKQMTHRLAAAMQQRILLFDNNGEKVFDSGPQLQNISSEEKTDTFYTIQVLKNMAGFIIKLLPDSSALPLYAYIDSTAAKDYPDADKALKGQVSMSAWENEEDIVVLSAAAPLYKNGTIAGAVFLSRESRDIQEDIGEVWINILKAFAATLVVTILLSIYLSGVIANPLKKLASAAEGVRKGKSNYTDIPDLSSRHDEIGELSIALRQMTRALWDRMDSIERFAADVSHELKNPLTSLRSAIETLNVVKKKTDRDKLMEVIKHDFERLDRLISDISNASRLDAELSREALQRVNLKEALHHLMDGYKDPLERKSEQNTAWKTSAKDNKIQMTLDCAVTDDIFVWGLEGRLGQVFQNLLTNALSFSPKDGSVSIYVAPQPGKRVKITIEDEGPGIPEAKLETIFERFYTQRPDHEAYGAHSGLGLSICRQIVTALGGDISAENITGKSGKISGAKFTVILNTT